MSVPGPARGIAATIGAAGVGLVLTGVGTGVAPGCAASVLSVVKAVSRVTGRANAQQRQSDLRQLALAVVQFAGRHAGVIGVVLSCWVGTRRVAVQRQPLKTVA